MFAFGVREAAFDGLLSPLVDPLPVVGFGIPDHIVPMNLPDVTVYRAEGVVTWQTTFFLWTTATVGWIGDVSGRSFAAGVFIVQEAVVRAAQLIALANEGELRFVELARGAVPATITDRALDLAVCQCFADGCGQIARIQSDCLDLESEFLQLDIQAADVGIRIRDVAWRDVDIGDDVVGGVHRPMVQIHEAFFLLSPAHVAAFRIRVADLPIFCLTARTVDIVMARAWIVIVIVAVTQRLLAIGQAFLVHGCFQIAYVLFRFDFDLLDAKLLLVGIGFQVG